MQTKILVLTIAAGCFAAGYYTRAAIADRYDAMATYDSLIEQQQAHQRQTYADMDRALRTEPVQDGSDYVKFQHTRQH